MNNFPAMTEAHRQQLIDWSKGYIDAAERYTANNPTDRSGKAYLELLQIALAALTAEPEYVRYSCGCCGYESLSYKHICPKCNHHTLQADKLYTAPPAPVLKPIELASDMKSNPRAHETMQAYRDGWNDRGKADVDMLLSAGYEVKS